MIGYVCGYGSLADADDWLISPRTDLPDGIYGMLNGYRRHWDMAMDNRATAHDHKYYRDAATGRRVKGYVATLGVEAAEGVACNAVAVPVDDVLLKKFDRREGQLYDRSPDLADRFSVQLNHPLWAYLPKASALRAFSVGLAAGCVWLPERYYEKVLEVFRGYEHDLSTFERSTRPPGCPLRDLTLTRAPGELGI